MKRIRRSKHGPEWHVLVVPQIGVGFRVALLVGADRGVVVVDRQSRPDGLLRRAEFTWPS